MSQIEILNVEQLLDKKITVITCFEKEGIIRNGDIFASKDNSNYEITIKNSVLINTRKRDGKLDFVISNPTFPIKEIKKLSIWNSKK